MATVTFETVLLQEPQVQAAESFLAKHNQSIASLGENSLFRFFVAANAPLEPVGNCKCAGCHIIRGIESSLLAMPLADLENKGILPLHDAAGKAMAEQAELQFAVCTSCFYVGFPTRQQMETSEYV
jgi:hypothetical protein